MKRNVIYIASLIVILILILKTRNENFIGSDTLTSKYTHPTQGQALRNIYQKPADFYRPSNTFLVSDLDFTDSMDSLTLPKNVESKFTEWIDKGFPAKPKDQMSCGGCWAFSVCETFGTRLRIATNGQLEIPFGLSEQYLISCGDKLNMQYWQGCGGGIPQYAMDVITETGVPVDEKSIHSNVTYSYYQTNPNADSSCALTNASTCPCDLIEGKIGDNERFKSIGKSHTYTSHGTEDQIHNIDLWPHIPPETIKKNVDRMKKAIYFEGPITVGYQVTQDFYQFQPTIDNYYKYDGRSAVMGGHAVAIAGWKTLDDGTPVWICKNSWGENWGYGFPDGPKWVSPVFGEEIKYKGGFWNHIMGINDSYIESNATGIHPDLSQENVRKYLPDGGKHIPKEWFKTMTLRDIYSHSITPSVKPTPTKHLASTDFDVSEKKLKVEVVPISKATLNQVDTFMTDSSARYIIAGSRNLFDAVIQILPDSTQLVNGDTIETIIEQIKNKITDYLVLGIKGDLSVNYFIFGDSNEWDRFNLHNFIGRTTEADVASQHLFYQIQTLTEGNVYFARSDKEKILEPFKMYTPNSHVINSNLSNEITLCGVCKDDYILYRPPSAYGVYLPYTRQEFQTGEPEKLESFNWRWQKMNEILRK